jgi:hypothetical protein
MNKGKKTREKDQVKQTAYNKHTAYTEFPGNNAIIIYINSVR